MAQKKQDLFILVRLGEKSTVKAELNRAVATLVTAPEECFQPHVCLNGQEGVENIKRIFRLRDETNTEYWIRPHLVHSGENVWLNASFTIFLDQISLSKAVALSPRQSAYVIQKLPPASQQAVIEALKAWYLNDFLPRIQRGLQVVSDQFAHGDPLLASDARNHILDIHGERGVDVPYTEGSIIGEKLFLPLFLGIRSMDRREDGYERMDALFRAIASARNAGNNRLVDAMMALGIVDSD